MMPISGVVGSGLLMFIVCFVFFLSFFSFFLFLCFFVVVFGGVFFLLLMSFTPPILAGRKCFI